MKKLLSFLIASLLPMAGHAHDIEVANADGVTIYYNYINSGTELKVTCQGDYYGRYLNEYKGNVVIPEKVTYMNRTRKVTSIGDEAFRGCSGLTSVTIPNSVTSIGDRAFYNCSSLTSVTIGNSVKSIGERAFYGCSSLTSVKIPNSVTSIGDEAFRGCGGLTSVHITDLESWCNISFNSGSNPLSYANHLFLNGEEINDLIIPSNVTSIGNEAFLGCRGLTSVTIPNSVTYIGYGAFGSCSGLTSVTIPNSVTSIGDWAFSSCSSLTSVTIGNSVTSIGNMEFYGCYSLTSVTIGNSVASIGDEAFRGCSSLSSVTIPNSVTSIGSHAFYDCSGLTSITIPNSVTSIGESAFDAVDILTVISLIEEPFVIEGKASFYRTFSQNTFMNATLYVPKGTIEKYKATSGWKDFLFIEEGTGPNGGETPETKTCATPIIDYQNGKLTFGCATEGATCQYTIADEDIKAGSGNEVQLAVTYTISVYATKAGYENSETATATLCWIDVEPRTEGLSGVADVPAKAMLMKSEGGMLSVQGADDGTQVCVYSLNGTMAGSAVSRNGQALVQTNLQPGSTAIVKIGQKSVKVRF